jgi:hypothetical protein
MLDETFTVCYKFCTFKKNLLFWSSVRTGDPKSKRSNVKFIEISIYYDIPILCYWNVVVKRLTISQLYLNDTSCLGNMDLKEGFPNDHSDFLVDKRKESLKIQREVITIRKSKKKDSQHNGQKKKGQMDKQRSTKLTHQTIKIK